MRKPVLLSGQTMTPAGILNPLTMSLTLMADDMSTASMTLDTDSPTVKCGNWVQIWAPNGTMCVMYIKSLKTDYNTGIRTIELEHCFALLEETVMFGEITTSTMGGSDTSVSAVKAIKYILKGQEKNIWNLGTCDVDFATGWEFTNSTILSALQDVMGALNECQWEFDQTSLPWKVSVKKWPTAATMEMRMNRNLKTLKITLDRSTMFTRCWPVGNKNLDISSVNGGKKYLDMNTGTWGIISQVITDSSITSAAHLKTWANAMLKKNSEPRITVSIDGLELSQATGESLDKIVIGRLCQVPLPEYGTTVTRRVSSLSWSNCIADEYAVTVTLANELKTLSGILKEKANSGSAGGRKSGAKTGTDLKDDEEQLQEFENSDIWINRESVWAVSANYDVYTDKDGVRHVRLKNGALLEVARDGGVYTTVGDLVGEYDEHNWETDEWRDSFEGSALWTQRDHITGVCGEYDIEYYFDKNGKRQKRLIVKSGGGMKIRRNNVEYGLYDEGNLTGGLMVQKINGQTETYLKGDKIVIGNDGLVTVLNGKITAAQVTTDLIQSRIANLSVLNVMAISSSGNISVSNGYIMAPYIYMGSAGSAKNLSTALQGVTLSGPTNNVYTLTALKFDGTTAEIGTFSRAVTSMGYSWSSGKLTVTAYPQNKSFMLLGVTGDGSWNGTTFNGRVKYYEGSDDETTYNTGATFTVDALDVFEQVAVTPQGSSEPVYIEATSGGSDYYTAGTTATYYNSGTTVTRYTRSGKIRLKHDGTARHYDVNGNLIGNHDWYHIVSTSDTSGEDYYKTSSESLTLRGGSVTVTPVNTSSKKHLLATTRYKAGQQDTTTYYKRKT